jgi:hypothetical protein
MRTDKPAQNSRSGLHSGPMVKRFARTLTLAAAALALVAGEAHAQWPAYPWKNMPRTADGKVDLSASPRRLPDGHIDLSGFWMPTNPVKHLLDLVADLEPGDVPFQPWAEAVYQDRIRTNGRDHPGARCLPSGIPEKNNIPDGLKVVQTPDVMIFLYESRTIYRQVFTDGRPLPPPDVQPTWMGYSIGHWEGDVFVVESRYSNGKAWLDMRGLPATDALRVVERYSRPTIGRIAIEVTIDDPKAYTRPWKVDLSWSLVPDTDLIESICEENNKAAHLPTVPQ